MDEPTLGTVIDGKYRVGEMVASGGMGSVFRAVHRIRRAPVALKFLKPSLRTVDGALPRFLREAVATSAVHTEHVVRIYDVGFLPDGMPYMVMELLDGKTLAEVLRAEGGRGLPVQRAIHFAMQILRALQAAHANGVVHRDLKPANCFVISHEGDRDFIKVLDFGVSKIDSDFEAVLTRADATLGTPIYMAPEQARSPGEVDARCDIYSAAVVLYRALCGKLPYRQGHKNSGELLAEVLATEPERLEKHAPALPRGLAEVVHRGMARDPAQRFQTAAEMAEALAPFAGARSVHVLAALRNFDPAASPGPVYEVPELPCAAEDAERSTIDVPALAPLLEPTTASKVQSESSSLRRSVMALLLVGLAFVLSYAVVWRLAQF
jgi:serine/threonine protein kinase